ncbi:MAG: terminase family protein [Bryobacteraceae bacterium]|nr:terminase family protein [Bryobacteraceae bacterium]
MISPPPPPFPLYQGHQLAANTLPVSGDTPLSTAQWVAQNLAFQPDPVQTEILDHPAHRLLLNCTRQWGKTTVCAAKALHFALNHPASTTLVAANCARQSETFLAKIHSFLQLLHIPRTPVPGRPASLLLPNRAQIFSLPGHADGIRGFTADLLIFDEAARVPHPLFAALTPSLATTGGPLWLLSTPDGPDNLFYSLWHDENAPFARFSVPASGCPRITPEFLESERLLLGDAAFRQEYFCEFAGTSSTAFPPDLIDDALDPSLQSLLGDKPLCR